MKDEIFELLKTKFAGVDNQFLGRVAEKISKTATDASEAVEAVTFANVLEMYGDMRATNASQTAVKNYERKWSLKDGKAIETQQSQQPAQSNSGDELAQTLQALMAQNKALESRLNAMDAEKVNTSRKSEIAKIVEKLPQALRKPYERMAFDSYDDEQFATLKTEIAGEVEQVAQNVKAQSAVFNRPKFATGSASTRGLSDEQIKAISKRDGIAGGEGSQPF